MSKNKSKFSRPEPNRRLRKVFVIATEGAVTEPQYFTHFNGQHINIKILKKRHKSSPLAVREALENYLAKNELYDDDEAWGVIDKDSWPDEQIDALHAWAAEDQRYNVAISDPRFEYWILLLHDDGIGVRTAKECIAKLKARGLNEKHIDMSKISDEMILAAITRAERRCIEKQNAKTANIASTNVYRLVASILRDLEDGNTLPV